MYLKIFVFFTCFLTLFKCRQAADPDPTLGGDARIQLLGLAIEEHPFEDSLYYLRAKYYYDQQGYNLAIRDLQYAIKLDSLQPDYYHLLADSYLDNQQSYEALTVLNHTTQLFPLRVLSLLKLCEFQYILKQHESSIITAKKIQAIDPLNAESFFMTGLNHRELRDTLQALSALRFATSLDDRHIDAWIVSGQLVQTSNPTLALSYYENALKADTTNIAALHSLAGFFQDRGNYEESLELYRKIIELDPTYSDAFVHSGMIYFNMDSFTQALNSFDILCRLEATNPDYPYYRGNAHEALGNKAAAILDYQQSLRLDPEHSRAKEALEKLK